MQIPLRAKHADPRNATACKRNPYKARTGGNSPAARKAARLKAKYGGYVRPRGKK